ncbi:MAG: S8 family serine peptidase [Bacteroidetes bacterium]|nr:S8 family serine peptidase [Bacteroidota bacterium]
MKPTAFFALLLLSIVAQAQLKFSPQARIFEQELSSYINQEDGSWKQVPAEKFIAKYDLLQMKGQWFLGALLLVDPDLDDSRLQQLGVQIESKTGAVWGVRVPLSSFYYLKKIPGIRYVEAGNSVSPELDRARASTRVDSVYMGLGDLKMPYTGKGVIIGIIDWGFDYTHPVFYDTTLQNYRVISAWDQNKTSGPGPAAYSFGTEYKGKDALLKAGDDTVYVFGPMSHGTHVGGIAGGGGDMSSYRGMAPEAEFVFVSLRRDDASFIAAINYISSVARAKGKPFVINMSFGNHSGPHDGSTLRNQAMDSLVSGIGVIVVAAGNNGGNYFHLLDDFQSHDTLITEVVSASGLSEYWGESVNIWAEPGSPFSIQLELCDANYTPVYQSNWLTSSDNLSFRDTLFQKDGDTLLVHLVSDSANVLNNKPNLLFESRNLGTLKLILRVSGTGKTHLWHVAQLGNRVTNWGESFHSGYPGAVQGNDDYGVAGPTGVGKKVITVASYLSEAHTPSGVETLGYISSYSSIGPTADERAKPDIAAPGENVASAVNSFDPNPGKVVDTKDFNGRTYSFVRYSGTSMASPATVGVVALMLQANRFLTASDIKEILKTTARLDANTGVIGSNGDLQWGWGKVDAYTAVRAAELRSGNVHIKADAPFTAYPNPLIASNLTIDAQKDCELRVLDLQGREMKCASIHYGNQQIDLSGFASGTYLLEWRSDTEVGFVKVVVQ